MSGFGTKTSDMDLCLMLSPHQVGINSYRVPYMSLSKTHLS